MKTAFVLMLVAAALMSCKKEEVFMDTFTPKPKDTTFISGANMRFTLNGNAFNNSTQGFGLSCTDTSGTFWALATGNGVIYDPITRSLSTALNDTTFALIFQSLSSGIGTYTIASPFDAVCFLDAPGQIFRQYDASQLQINISRITADSIFGSYAGALPEMQIGVDSLGNLIPIYSGVIDSVNAAFGVRRNPC